MQKIRKPYEKLVIVATSFGTHALLGIMTDQLNTDYASSGVLYKILYKYTENSLAKEQL